MEVRKKSRACAGKIPHLREQAAAARAWTGLPPSGQLLAVISQPEGEPLPRSVADTIDRARSGEKGSPLPTDLIQPFVADLVATLGWEPDQAEQVVQDLGAGEPGDAP